MFHGDFAQLDVPVAGELVPTHLNGPADEVWFVRRQTSCPPALAPFPQQGHTAEHRRLARAGRRCAEGVLRLGRVPEVGEDVDTPRLNRRGLRILVLVDHVLIECLAHEVPNFGLQPGLAKRRKVLTRIAVEDQLVGNEPICGEPNQAWTPTSEQPRERAPPECRRHHRTGDPARDRGRSRARGLFGKSRAIACRGTRTPRTPTPREGSSMCAVLRLIE